MFCGFLRADTEVIVTIGPFVDVGDGFTPQTDIALSGNEAELLKHGSTTVVDISEATWAAVTNCRGYYSLTLTTSHTDTEGQLTVIVQDDSDCLPVHATFEVVNANVYDSLFAAAGTDLLQVDVDQVDGDATAAANLNSACDNYSVTRGLTGTALPAAAAGAAGGIPLSTAGSLEMDTLADWVDAGRLDAILDTIAADTTTDIPALIGTAQADLDIITGASGVNLLTATQASIDAIETDTSSTLDTLIKDIPTTAEFEARTLPSADYVVTTDTIAGVTTCTTNSDMRGTDDAALATGVDVTSIHGSALTETVSGYLAAAFTKLFDVATPVLVASDVMRGTDSAALASVCTETRLAELDAANLPTDVAAIPTTAMRGTDDAALASVCTETRLAELDAANLPTDIAAIPTTAMRGTDDAALASVCTETRLAELDAANLPTDIADIPTTAEFNARTLAAADYVVTSDTIAGVTTVTNLTNAPTSGDLTATMKASVNAECDTAISDAGLPEGIEKNAACPNIEFLMVDSTDFATPETGLTVSGQRSIDGGAFASVSGSIAEVSNGVYQFDALAADTNGDIITYRFYADGAADTFMTIKTTS